MRSATPHVCAMLLSFLAAAPAASAHLGSPVLEPCLQGRDDIVFFEDFEQADYYTHWGESSAPANVQRVGSGAYDGDWSLQVTVPQGQHTGIAWRFDFTDQGLAEPEETYFRYYVYLGDDWRLSAGGQIGKLPGPAGTYNTAGWGGRPSHGDDGWSARMCNWDRGDAVEVGYYCYHADMTGIYGDTWAWGSDAQLQRQRWTCIETYARMNSITDGHGNNDGVLRGWVDGQQVFEKADIRFRDVDRLKIEMIWFNVYVGGTWSAEQDMHATFDNMVIAHDPIGRRAGWGDANRDGLVDGSDYTLWADHYGQSGAWDDGDFNADAVVEGGDYTLWADHYAPAGAADPIPEPAAVMLLLAGWAVTALGPAGRFAAAAKPR